MKRCLGFAVLVGLLATVPAASAAAKDYADTALNIIPSGQYGAVPPPPGAEQQAEMYNGLTPLFDDVTDADLTTYFKSEKLGVGPDGPTTVEDVPRKGVKILRDRFNVPHVKAKTYEDGIWAAGWIAAADRGLLMGFARYNARVAAIDVPGLSAVGLITSLSDFEPSAQTEKAIAKQTKVLKNKGREGRALLSDIDTFLDGINAYRSKDGPDDDPWTRVDMYSLSALKGQFLGQGGGDESRRSEFLAGLQDRLGEGRGTSVFDDLRQFTNPDSPISVKGDHPYGKIPNKHPGSVILDPGSFEASDAVAGAVAREAEETDPIQASNTLMIDRKHSATGDPIMVGGPQIGYFYPGFTYEIDMNAPGLKWRGATSVPFPGYLLIGRGEDFATTLTSAGADIIDQYAETLCGGSDTKYLFEGKCRSMKTFDAGTLGGEPVRFKTTVHGSVVGYATVDGERVAISARRSSYGKDILDQLYFRRLSNGQVDSPESFFKAASKTPQTFNSFYMDDKDLAMYVSGKLPLRPKKVDPGLPTIGTGEFEWKGFLARDDHPQGKQPKGGTMVNWNNISAHGFGAADDQWGGNGSAARVDMLNENLARLQKGGKWTHASVTSAMNAAASQDVRAIDTVPLLAKLLEGSTAPNAQAQEMLDLMVAWRQNGGNRLDLTGDGKIDDPGAAVMDGSWDLIADAFMRPVIGPQLDELDSLFSRFDQPPSGQYDGWYQYFERDVGELLGEPVKQPFRNSYCGGGNTATCQADVWEAIADAGVELTASQGTADPSAWRSDATAEEITFSPVNLLTMAYTNRPSGIQQVISFDGHRK